MSTAWTAQKVTGMMNVKDLKNIIEDNEKKWFNEPEGGLGYTRRRRATDETRTRTV